MARKKSVVGRREGKTTSPVVKIEVSIPEARRAVEAFAGNRLAALEAFSLGVREGATKALNQLLNAEMSFFLGQPDQQDNRRNGYSTREYSLKRLGTVQLRVPRDRKGDFKSVIVPPNERIDPRLKRDLALLHLAGISSRTLATISNTILGLEVSRETVLASLGPLQERAQRWLTRPLEGEHWALYIDATNFRTQRRGSTELEPSLIVVGVNEANHRSILAIEPGTRDDVQAWRSVFRDLKQRGLDPGKVRVGVMDGLPGLERAFVEAYPNAKTARCWLHALTNALAKTPARLRAPFKELAHKVMYAQSEDDARKAFAKLKDAMLTDAQRAVSCLEKDLDSLVAHYRFERKYWTALKTTNAVERVHRELKRRTRAMDTIGEGNLSVVVAFTALRLEAGWRRQRIDSRSIHNLAAHNKIAIAAEDATAVAMDTLSNAS